VFPISALYDIETMAFRLPSIGHNMGHIPIASCCLLFSTDW